MEVSVQRARGTPGPAERRPPPQSVVRSRLRRRQAAPSPNQTAVAPITREDGSGTSRPRISPARNPAVWILIYALPASMSATRAGVNAGDDAADQTSPTANVPDVCPITEETL